MPIIIDWLYKHILKPVLFRIPADYAHEWFAHIGFWFGRFTVMRWLFKILFGEYKDTILSQDVLGIHFANPVGLSAGFDCDADLVETLPALSFGFHTIGTVTNIPYQGNPAPRLSRLPKSKSILVNKGFKGIGMTAVLKKIQTHYLDKDYHKQIPIGLSIGVTNAKYKSFSEMVDDVYVAFKAAKDCSFFDYLELNISCPNLILVEATKLRTNFDKPEGLQEMLEKLHTLHLKQVFIKMHAEKTLEETMALLEIAERFAWIKGLVFSNLIHNRDNQHLDRGEVAKYHNHVGNFSGRPVKEASNVLLREVYRKYKNRFVLIGVGGIFTGADAYEKIRNGATLVGLVTSLIFEGPHNIPKINKELAELLRRDGYKNIQEAVGVDLQ